MSCGFVLTEGVGRFSWLCGCWPVGRGDSSVCLFWFCATCTVNRMAAGQTDGYRCRWPSAALCFLLSTLRTKPWCRTPGCSVRWLCRGWPAAWSGFFPHRSHCDQWGRFCPPLTEVEDELCCFGGVRLKVLDFTHCSQSVDLISVVGRLPS